MSKTIYAVVHFYDDYENVYESIVCLYENKEMAQLVALTDLYSLCQIFDKKFTEWLSFNHPPEEPSSKKSREEYQKEYYSYSKLMQDARESIKETILKEQNLPNDLKNFMEFVDKKRTTLDVQEFTLYE